MWVEFDAILVLSTPEMLSTIRCVLCVHGESSERGRPGSTQSWDALSLCCCRDTQGGLRAVTKAGGLTCEAKVGDGSAGGVNEQQVESCLAAVLSI